MEYFIKNKKEVLSDKYYAILCNIP